MGIDLKQIKNRLNKLQSSQSRAAEQWKPTPGTHQVRIVPYKYNKDNPFIELYFHYNVKGKTYVSPQSFGRPDPIVEFAGKLKRVGDRDDWKAAKKMEPKLRTYVPVLVRGEEDLGVRFWGFGKTVYQELLGYIADPDYGDITDPKSGRDITVEYISAEDAGTNYPVTKIRVKPKETLVHDDVKQAKELLNNQVEITELYQELTYDELKEVLNSWLDPNDESSDNASVSQETLSSKTEEEDDGDDSPFDPNDDGADVLDELVENGEKAKKKPAKKSVKVDDVESAFDDLFND